MEFLRRGLEMFSDGFFKVKKTCEPPSGYRHRKIGEISGMTIGEISGMTMKDLLFVRIEE